MKDYNIEVFYGYTPKDYYLTKKQQIDNLAVKLKEEVEFEMKVG